jgi:PAS domain S-box-containing protein
VPTPLRREKSQTRFLKILEATTDVVAIIDRRGRMLYLNEAGRSHFGWGPETVLRRHLDFEMYPSWAYQVILHEAMPTAVREGSWSGETALLGANGREFPVLQVILAHQGQDGQVEFFSTICRDISERKQKEVEHIEWANRYDAAIRASGQVLFDWDSASGEMTYSGDIERLTGYAMAEMSGGLPRLRKLILPADLPAFDAEIERVQLARDPFHHAFRIARKSGAVAHVDARGFFFLDRQGRIGRMVGFFRDVTVERSAEEAIHAANELLEQRVAERTAALERSARRQETLARLGQRALAGLQLEQLMQEAVEIACKGLQGDCASVLEYDAGHDTFFVRAEVGWPTPGAPHYIPGGTSSQSGYAVLTGTPVIAKDLQHEHRFSVSEVVRLAGMNSGMSACIQAGERPLGVLNVFQRNSREYSPDDVNFLQSVANVLTAAIERHRVESDLRRARAESEAANRAKSEFLSRMSHELRTPLNAILGFSQLLEIEEHNERQAESIQHITRAGHNLLNLINEVLDIARIDAGRINLQVETVELPGVLAEIAALASSLALGSNITFTLGDLPKNVLPCVVADRERLKQVLLNLTSNGFKYNRPGGSVTIATNLSGNFWRISVTDTGPGIPEELLPRLFTPFERLGMKEGGTADGTGLGLALSKRLITALGGQIGVSSTVGVGSTFWLELPAANLEVLPKVEKQEETPRHVRREEWTVLYIEDDVANFYLLERILRNRKGLKLVSALQGSIGLEIARTQKPDLILLDLNLPDMSGEQLLRTLRAEERTASIPVITVTGEVDPTRAARLQPMGVLGNLLKPYRVQELIELVEQGLGADFR